MFPKVSKTDLSLVAGTVLFGSAGFVSEEYFTTFAMLSGATALSGLVFSRALRGMVFGNVKKDWIAGELEFDRLNPDNQTVQMKNGSVFRMIEIEGIAYDTKIEFEQENLLSIRAGLMKAITEEFVTMRLFAIKRKENASYEAKWPTPVLNEIGNKERELFANTFNLRWIVILESESVHALEKAVRSAISTLKEYKAHVLEGTEIYSVLNYLLCGELLSPEHFELRTNISSALPASDLTFDIRTGSMFTATPERHESRIISIRAWPAMISGRILAELLAVIGDVEFHQIVKPESELMVKSKASAEERAEAGIGAIFLNAEKADERHQIIEAINSDITAMVMTQSAIVYRAKTSHEVDMLELQIVDILNKFQVVYAADQNCVGTYWFNRLPGKNSLVRELRLTSINIAGLWAFHNSPSGQYESPWGDRPLRLFKTPVGQNYAFNFFNSAEPESLGHFLIIAPAGGGKSTLIAHLLGGASKFDIPSILFDSHQGMRWMVECMGGKYSSIDSLELNPFDCEISQEKSLHLLRLLRSMGEIQDEETQLLIEQMFALPREDRSLNAVYSTAFDTHGVTAKNFAPWVTDEKGNQGLYADFFNAPKDSLSNMLSQSFMTGIDLGDLLKDESLAAPIIMHITDALRTISHKKRGFCIFIDEAAALFKNKGFRDSGAVMYREYRKLGGSVGTAFQDPKGFFDSGISDAVLDNTATIILLPNSQGTPEAYQRFGLNDEQLNYILTGSELSNKRTALVIKRDNTGKEESAIIDIDLSPYGDKILTYYQSGSRVSNQLDDLQRNWGASWRDHI